MYELWYNTIMNHFIIAQGIGLIGVVCFIISFQIKSNRVLYITQSIANIMFIIQFLLLGAISGCYTLLIMIIRNVLLTRYNEWKWVRWKGWIVIFCLLGVAATVYTWDGPVSLLPLIAVISSNIGLWTNNAGIIRLANLVCISPAFLAYDIIVGAYAGVLNELLVVTSVIISIVRFGWASLFSKESEFQK